MDFTKKEKIIFCISIVVIVIGLSLGRASNANHSLSDYGVSPLMKNDCSSLKNVRNSYPVSLSFSIRDVPLMREKIRTMVLKYNGHISNDSFSSNQISDGNTFQGATPQDNASMTVQMVSQNEFLTELTALIKSSGGLNTYYNYTDANDQVYNAPYSIYKSCLNSMQTLSSDILQLEIFTDALRDERNKNKLYIISQSVSNFRTNVENDVSAINAMFTTPDKPTINISINTFSPSIK